RIAEPIGSRSWTRIRNGIVIPEGEMNQPSDRQEPSVLLASRRGLRLRVRGERLRLGLGLLLVLALRVVALRHDGYLLRDPFNHQQPCYSIGCADRSFAARQTSRR